MNAIGCLKSFDDYYLLVWDMTDDIQISDNLNTDFQLIYQDLANDKVVICMEPIMYDLDYELYINDSVVDFDE